MNKRRYVIAHSLSIDSQEAVDEVIASGLEQLAGTRPQAGILFCGIEFDHQLILGRLIDTWPDLPLIGCTTDGELSSLHGYVEDSVCLLLIQADGVNFFAGCIDNSTLATTSLAEQAIAAARTRLGNDPALCLLFSDVLKVNGEDALARVSAALGGGIPILGGISGDSWTFTGATQFCGRQASSDISPFLLIAGELEFSYAVDYSWTPLGGAGTVTRAEGHVVYTIDDKPALAFYEKILGPGIKPSGDLPIAVFDVHDDFRFLRVSFEKSDAEAGSVTYLGNVPEGSRIRITSVSRDDIIAGAGNAAAQAAADFSQRWRRAPLLALCFSCSARRVLLGTRTHEEYEAVRKPFGEDFRIAGFYTYGEYCPRASQVDNEFHNETLVILLL